jgi:biotin carboxyl carrier protein
MRTVFLIPLAFTTAVIVGCGAEVSKTSEREETASRTAASLKRDLTLSVPRIAETEVASAVELSLPRPAPAPTRTHRPRPKPTPAPAPSAEPEHDAAAEPVSAPTLGEALAELAPLDDAAAGGRELAPGKTVTIIPVSSGPSVEADEGDSWVPSEPSRGILVGGGGTCRRRGGGGGIGIAARFPVGIPTLRLR